MSVEMIVLCLRRYGEHRTGREASRERLADFLSAGTILNRTEVDALTNTLRDPVASSLQLRVRDIGWKLWANGGTKEMQRVADLVAEAMPDHPELALSTLGKWWDGIGSDKSRWLA